MVSGLVLSYSDHSGFMVLGRSGEEWAEVRQLKGKFVGKDLSSIVFSEFHGLIGFILGDVVFIVHYEQLKIVHKLVFCEEDKPTSVTFINGLQLILVGTSQGNIYVFELGREGNFEKQMKIDCGGQKIIKVIADIECRKIGKKTKLDKCLIYCSTVSGKILVADIT